MPELKPPTIIEFIEARLAGEAEALDQLRYGADFRECVGSARGPGWGYRECPSCSHVTFDGNESVTADEHSEHIADSHDWDQRTKVVTAMLAILTDHAPTDQAYERLLDFNEDGSIHRVSGEPACRQCTESTQQWRVTTYWDVADRVVAPCDTVRTIAAIWADHPDYRQEWA